MLIFLIVMFILTATGGLYLLSHVMRNKEVPKRIALLHGGAAVMSVCLLSIYTYYHPKFLTPLIIFIFTGIGGIYLFSRGLLGHRIPKLFAVGHGTAAIIGIACLVLYACCMHVSS